MRSVVERKVLFISPRVGVPLGKSNVATRGLAPEAV